MRIRFLQIKRVVSAALFVVLFSIAGMTKAQTENITFADANVKAICVANWDTDGDGELNTTEAAAVTNLDGMFMFDDGITSFNELQFFTGLTSFGEDEFNSCTSLASITIPNAVTSIGNYAFSDCSSLTSMTSYACTPPALGNDVFYNVPSMVILNVPCHTSAMYQEADGWSDFSNYEEFEYGLCPIPFADATVKAICVAHWDTNEDGELSYAEAAAVTNLGTYFKSTTITSFDELEYFTSLTSLPNTAFYGCSSLASIAIPSFVSVLGNGSFYNCTSLATITVYAETPPTVGTNAFKNVPTTMVVHVPCGTYEAYHTASGWNEFTIIQQSGSCPIVFADANVKALCVANWDTNGDGELSYDEAAAVTDLGTVFKNQYYNITSFNELQYFTGLTSIGSDAFYYCYGLTSIEIPNSVTLIDNYAFYYCTSLTSVEIPSSVTSIGNEAFYNCSSLTSVEIPSSVTSIGGYAFRSCSGLEQIVVASDNAHYDSRENCNAIISTSNNALVTGCKNTMIPNSVTLISNYAFFNCSSLTSIEIPSSVTSISYSAFSNCTNLTSIEIPNSVTSIGNDAFSGCSGLEQIVVASDNAYYDSRENCNAIIRTSNNALVTGCKNTVIPNSVTSIGIFAFGGCTSLTSIEIPSSVTSIGNYAFTNCTNLTSIEIPSSVTSISYSAFFNCTSLTSIEIPSSVTSIGDYAFYDCTSLTSIEIPSSVTSIGSYAFCYCTSLTSIELPSSVTSIGSYVFYNCTSLTSIELPSSVTSIGNNAFYYCTGLTAIASFADTPPTLDNSVFYSVNKSIPVYVPCGTTETYQGTNGWNEFSNIMGMCPGTITVSALPAEGGMVTGGGSYEGGGATCTLTATANHDYHFLNWTENGEVVSSDAEYTFLVTGDRNLVANFSFTPPAPVVAEYYPDPNEPDNPYVKVHWAASSFEAQIGEGDYSSFGYFPFYTLYNYSIAENLFLASELEAAGVTSSPMTSLSWYATNAPGYEQQGISIWMANVSDTELTTISHTVSGMTLVYTGTMTPEIGWNEFVFNEGNFVWDGVSNVLIFCQRNNGVWNSTVYWQSQDVGFNASSYRYQDSGPYNVNIANTMNTNTKRPNIIMKGEGATTYNLYRANCDGTNAQLIAENLNDTQYIDETWWQLENDSYKYGVSIADSTNTDIFWSNCIEKQGDVVVQTCALSQGWNWFSTYIEVENPVAMLQLLEVALGEKGLYIESSELLSTEYLDGEWIGDLEEVGITNEQMYLIQTSDGCTIQLHGMVANPINHEITIHPEWNWVGYPCSEEMTIAEALAGFVPEDGDRIESLEGYAEYLDGEWLGLETLKPGQGFLYYSNSATTKTFTFPANAK